jgi:hypothetical protein
MRRTRQADYADLSEGEVVDRELLVARGDRRGFLEGARRALDGAAPTVRLGALDG